MKERSRAMAQERQDQQIRVGELIIIDFRERQILARTTRLIHPLGLSLYQMSYAQARSHKASRKKWARAIARVFSDDYET